LIDAVRARALAVRAGAEEDWDDDWDEGSGEAWEEGEEGDGDLE
jgi:hypothetical protein